MPTTQKSAVALLALCAAADLTAAIPLLAMSGPDGPPIIVGLSTALFGVLTVIAAVGIARDASWGRPLAVATRALDVLGALPGLGGGVAQALAIGAVMIVSVASIVLVLRLGRSRAGAPAVIAATRPY